MRIIGFDIGTKRIGVALSDQLAIAANAKGVFEYKGEEELIEKIKERIKQFEVDEVVLGLPVNMNGTIGESAKKILQLADTLRKKLTVPINVFDERLSTVMAENFLKEADLSRKKRKKVIDTSSAQIILQGYLDARGTKRED